MKTEYASTSGRSTRSHVKPPTAAEFALAARSGHESISGAMLKQMRADARKPLARAAAPQPAPTDAAMIAELKKRIVALERENTKLKVKLMTAS